MDKKSHLTFSLRKLAVGLCSVALLSGLVNTPTMVHASSSTSSLTSSSLNKTVTVENEGYAIYDQITDPALSLSYDKDSVKSIEWYNADDIENVDLDDSTDLTAVVTFKDNTTKTVTITVYRVSLSTLFQNQIEDNMSPLYYTDDTPLTSISDDLAENTIGTVNSFEYAGMTISPEITSITGNDNGSITITYADGSDGDVIPEKVKVSATASKQLIHGVTTDYGDINFTGATPASVDKVTGIDNSTVGEHTAKVEVTMANGQVLEVPMTYTVVASEADNSTVSVADSVSFKDGQLPKAETLVEGTLPSGASASWEKEPTDADPTGTVRITFSDGSTKDFSVSAKIYSDGDSLTTTESALYAGMDSSSLPYKVASSVTFDAGDVPAASTLLSGSLPSGASAKWSKTPTASDPNGVITVTFSDGSTLDYAVTGQDKEKADDNNQTAVADGDDNKTTTSSENDSSKESSNSSSDSSKESSSSASDSSKQTSSTNSGTSTSQATTSTSSTSESKTSSSTSSSSTTKAKSTSTKKVKKSKKAKKITRSMLKKLVKKYKKQKKAKAYKKATKKMKKSYISSIKSAKKLLKKKKLSSAKIKKAYNKILASVKKFTKHYVALKKK
ncbi:MAG: Rib/alpha-like domain-containing protein [Lactobacillus sp.]|nr:Rib/alpha-like domain-containing protein [Lactobacillus sp.]